ncbi:AAA family ATPase [Ornithinibacillus bavariensis]|uniref:ATP-binding protein n=1 Tax=Ornithinibacillus bavariensis TaxID=545502 RepID=UPI000EF05314|nr:recombinase RecF [Ornithinibacillus sp.]
MNRYKISRIYLKNFKHIEELLLDFSGTDLIVLDGPNGFGKTTIFDAIELILTGVISRIKNTVDGRYGFREVLFSNNHDVDTEIKVEFSGEIENLIIGKRINSKNSFKAVDKKPDNWDIFETYLLSDFNIPIEEGKIITQEEIGSILSIDNLKRYFSLFYYVQQEENTLFLKQDAKDRMDDISQLFDTYKEERELEKLEKLKYKITSELREIDGPKGLLADRKKTIELLKNGLKEIKSENIKEVEFFSLLEEKENIKEWDKELTIVNKESRDKFLQELREIYILVKDREKFRDTEFNNYIYKVIENKTLLKQTILTYNQLENYQSIKKLRDNEVSLKRIKNKLSKENLKDNLNITYFKELNNILDTSINTDDILNEIDSLKVYKSRMGEVSELIHQLNLTRESLLVQFNKIKEEFDNTKCPLCGSQFKSYEQLIASIDEKKTLFLEMLDEDTKKYDEFYNEFFFKYVNNTLLLIEGYLSTEDNIVDEDFYNELVSAISNKSSINQFVQWCKKNNLDINIFLNNGFKKQDDDLETRLSRLIEYLLQQIKPVVDSYSNHKDNVKILSSVFKNDLKKVFKIDLEDIIKKVQYIEYQYYYNSTESINNLQKEIDYITVKLSKLKLAQQKFEAIIDIYKERILDHWKNIIRDIEIPFYIYSGKIIQNYQKGCGLFISESDNFGQKSIKFVSDMKFDHDAINYLSSGQLSGLAIALTLALNKVYGEKSIDLIMIDDPVQTMDEINIASLTEILRNEFKEKQIIMSTHEEEVSRYIRYKFAKYNLNTKRINIKNEIYSNSI